MHSEADQLDPDDPPASRRWQVFSLPAVLAIGWLIYEVSHSPGLAAMVMCLKFGWEDFRTSIWLRRRDPWDARGHATQLLYLASGMWKAAMVGIVMVFATIVVSAAANAGNANNANLGGNPVNAKNAVQALQDIQTLILGAFGATLFGQAIASLCCGRAMAIARRHRIPLWLSGTLHYARYRNDWPPLYGHSNRILLLIASCFLFNWLIFTPMLALTLAHTVNFALNLQIPTGAFFFPLFFGYLWRAIVIGNRHQELGLIARHPAQCWLKPEPAVAEGDE